MARFGAVPWLAGSLGVGLVWAAIANKHPLDLLVATMTPGGNVTVRPLRTPPTDTPATSTAIPDAGAAGDVDPAGLVRIGQGNHRLESAAAASFKRWEQAVGHPLKVTGTFRSYAEQKAAYEAAEARGEHGRFARPGTSWHEKGRAVDLNLQAMGFTGPGQASYDRMRRIGEGLGWCFPRAKPNGDGKEPWHASYGGCG